MAERIPVLTFSTDALLVHRQGWSWSRRRAGVPRGSTTAAGPASATHKVRLGMSGTGQSRRAAFPVLGDRSVHDLHIDMKVRLKTTPRQRRLTRSAISWRELAIQTRRGLPRIVSVGLPRTVRCGGPGLCRAGVASCCNLLGNHGLERSPRERASARSATREPTLLRGPVRAGVPKLCQATFAFGTNRRFAIQPALSGSNVGQDYGRIRSGATIPDRERPPAYPPAARDRRSSGAGHSPPPTILPLEILDQGSFLGVTEVRTVGMACVTLVAVPPSFCIENKEAA